MSIPWLWIDTDTGVDDAIALMTAASLEKKGLLRIAGVSAVCGNVEEEKTFRNARNVLHMTGRSDLPVYPGAKAPLLEKLQTGAYVHGEDGLGGAQLEESPAPTETMPAWDAMYRCAKEHPGALELVLMGPETNAAIALQKYPDFARLLKRILIMGGAEVGGNVIPAAEFNIWVDPHAAQVVFKCGVPIVMCGLDVTMKAALTRAQIDQIEAGESAGCRFFRKATRLAQSLYARYAGDAYFAHDVCPVLYAVYPEMFSGEEAGVFVETQGAITRGKTVSDRDTDVKFGVKNAVVVLDLDQERFARIVTEALQEL